MTPSNVLMFKARDMIEKHGVYVIVEGDPRLLHRRLYSWTVRNHWTGYHFAQDLHGGVKIVRVDKNTVVY